MPDHLLNPVGTATRQNILDLFDAIILLVGGRLDKTVTNEVRSRLISNLNK